jgi:hypothetical protein
MRNKLQIKNSLIKCHKRYNSTYCIVNLQLYSPNIKSFVKYSLCLIIWAIQQGCKNPTCQVTMPTLFCALAPNTLDTCFMSTCWCLEFQDGCKTFGAFIPCYTASFGSMDAIPLYTHAKTITLLSSRHKITLKFLQILPLKKSTFLATGAVFQRNM